MKENKMRRITLEMKRKRGCMYCAEMVSGKNRKECPRNECIYHELDGFESYSQYLKQKGKLSVAQLVTLLKNVTSCD